MVDFILKHKDKYPIAKIIGMLRELDSLDKVWFNKLDDNVVEALLDQEFRDELNREYGWKIYDIECRLLNDKQKCNLFNNKQECRLNGKCIEGGVIVSKHGLSIEEILREF